MIPYFRLRSNEKELEEITKAHQTNGWVNGDHIEKVKEELKALFRRKHIVLTSNGNSALLVALKAQSIKEKLIIVPGVSTCFAITNAVITSGNTPVFCDVDPKDGNPDVDHVLKLAKQRKIQYIISPNFAGNLSDGAQFKENGLTVIEDACQSFHSSSLSSSDADIQVLSFYPTKGMNGVDGGALLMNNESVSAKASKFVYYDDQSEFETEERYNFRYLNMHAAVLYANLKRIKETQEKLEYIRTLYTKTLNRKKGISILQNEKSKTLQRFVVKVDDPIKLKEVFKNSDIVLSPFFIWNCRKEEQSDLPNATKMINNTFCVPYFEDLTDREIDSVIKAMDSCF